MKGAAQKGLGCDLGSRVRQFCRAAIAVREVTVLVGEKAMGAVADDVVVEVATAGR